MRAATLPLVEEIFAMFPNTQGGRRYSLQGMNDISVMTEFADKKEAQVGIEEVYRMGHCCKKGLKPESPKTL